MTLVIYPMLAQYVVDLRRRVYNLLISFYIFPLVNLR